jgi:periplasmic divalent cation tolerance protein
MCPDDDTAQLIAHSLVESRLAASVNILPGLRSTYWWQGKVESAEEHLLLIKTRRDRYPEVEGMIRNQHPHELPSIVCVPIDTGLSHYLSWIDQSISETS